MRRLPALLLVLLAVPAGAARAATVEVQGGALRYTAAAGEENHPILHHRAEDELVVFDSATVVIAGPGCAQDGENTAICPRAGVDRADVFLGDRRAAAAVPDSVTLTADVPVSVNASAEVGSGARATYIELLPVAVFLDGIANDGSGVRRDNIGPGIDAIGAGDGSDTLVGNERANAIYGNHGSDWVNGNGGDDTITLASYNDVGADAVGLDREGEEDYALCGDGADVVYADDSDLVEDDCEIWVRVHDRGFTYNGTRRADRIIA
ncbi:MAG: hypothetical protein M3340_19870, partial [Actinomycetota bacterium]|nr:hypothetical protein [Actinomycetota bacterium]